MEKKKPAAVDLRCRFGRFRTFLEKKTKKNRRVCL
jgi:hypothetical protein